MRSSVLTTTSCRPPTPDYFIFVFQPNAEKFYRSVQNNVRFTNDNHPRWGVDNVYDSRGRDQSMDIVGVNKIDHQWARKTNQKWGKSPLVVTLNQKGPWRVRREQYSDVESSNHHRRRRTTTSNFNGDRGRRWGPHGPPQLSFLAMTSRRRSEHSATITRNTHATILWKVGKCV